MTDWRLSFVVLAAVWGASFAFIEIALRDLGPTEVAFARVALGTLALLALVLVLRERLPRGRGVWGHLFVLAALFNSVPFLLLTNGQERIPSALAGLINATVPLMAAVATFVLLPAERPTRARVAGLALGFAGVVVVLGPWRGVAPGSLAGQLMILGATACYGVGFAYTRRFLSGRPESGVSISAAQLLLATAQLAVVELLFGHVPGAISAGTILALLGLGCFGTGVMYVLNFHIIRQAGPTTASTVTYLVPIVSTALGVFALGEELTWNEPVGALVVLTGVALSARAAARAPVPVPAPGS